MKCSLKAVSKATAHSGTVVRIITQTTYPRAAQSARHKYPFQPACVCELSRFCRVPLFLTPWTAAHQAPLSMGFSRPEYWSGLPFPSPGYIPDPGFKHMSLYISCRQGFFFFYHKHNMEVLPTSISHQLRPPGVFPNFN